MKTKLGLPILFVGILVASCSATKSVRTQRNLVNGNWELQDVSYENNEGSFQATLFGDAKAICFEGSDWFFRNNNSTGQYTLQNGSLCQGGDRLIRWSIIEPADRLSQLQFKFIDERKKDITGSGYRLDIANLNEQNMTLKSNVTVDGEPITVVYEFTRK